MHLVYVVITICYILKGVKCQFNDPTLAELNLTRILFSGYNKIIRPTNLVKLYVGLKDFELVGIDEKNQIMTSICNFYQVWQDPRLSWDQRQYDNITLIKVPMDLIWKPMTIFKNSANSDGFLPINKEYSGISIYFQGWVMMQTQIISLQTRCKLNIEKYPFDKQTCFITLEEFPYLNNTFYLLGSSLNMDNSNAQFMHENLSIGVRNSIWSVIESFQESVSNNTKYNITISLRRKPSFYILNIIIPCDILNLIIIFAFFIPFANQMALGMLKNSV